MELTGRQVVVLGLARSGRAAALVARDRGATVVGADRSTAAAPIPGVRLELGDVRPETFATADLVVVSPGVPPANPGIRAAEAAGVPVVGELGFARWFLADRPCVAITGTNGKSTVTTFVGQLLAASGFTPFVGGNLGEPLSAAVGTAPGVLVVEVSSYQLERAGGFRPDVGVILNLTPDHLARHGSLERYAATKARLFEHLRADDLGVVPHGHGLLRAVTADLPGSRAWLDGHPGVTLEGRDVTVALPDGRSAVFDLGALAVPGGHNRANAAAALLVAFAIGAEPDALQAGLATLRGLPHRMEVVRDDGVRWIDDSKATNVEATAVGLAGMDRPAVVLLGGQAKGAGFDTLVPLLEEARATVTFGASGPDIADELTAAGLAPVRAGTLEDAVARARVLARPGDAVLLSPGCASFDAFTDFTHRGRVFRALAEEEAR